MKMKGIRELLITDVVSVTGLFSVQSDWQGKGNSTVVPVHIKKAHRKRAGTALFVLNLSNREGEWSTSAYLLL